MTLDGNKCELQNKVTNLKKDLKVNGCPLKP